jgi:hypothetical protein
MTDAQREVAALPEAYFIARRSRSPAGRPTRWSTTPRRGR